MNRHGFAAIILTLACALGINGQSEDPAALAAQAKQAMASSRFVEAAELYQKLAPYAPDNPGLLTNLGMALHLAGKDAEAIEPLSTAVAKAPDAFPAQLFLGTSYFRLGQIDKAVAPLEQAAKLEPKHIDVRRMLGDIHTAGDRPDQALTHLKAIANLDPDSPLSWAALGQAHEQIAQQAFQELEKAAPESAYMLRLVGDLRFSTQQYPSAFYLYREALKRKPGWRGLHSVLAEIYRRTDQAEWATAEQAKEAALGEMDCEVERYECLFAQRKTEQLAAAVANVGTPEGLFWRAQAGNILAAQAFDKLDGLKPSVALHSVRAELFKSRRQFPQAAEQWKQALTLAPDDEDLRAELAIALFQSRQFDEAEPYLKGLLGKFPKESNWPFMLGDILLNRQEVEAAVPLLEKSVALQNDLLPAHHALGRSYMQLGRDADAIGSLKLALPLDNDGSLHYQLAQAYRATGDRDAAAPVLEKYQEIQAAQRKAEEEFQRDIQITAP